MKLPLKKTNKQFVTCTPSADHAELDVPDDVMEAALSAIYIYNNNNNNIYLLLLLLLLLLLSNYYFYYFVLHTYILQQQRRPWARVCAGCTHACAYACSSLHKYVRSGVHWGPCDAPARHGFRMPSGASPPSPRGLRSNWPRVGLRARVRDARRRRRRSPHFASLHPSSLPHFLYVCSSHLHKTSEWHTEHRKANHNHKQIKHLC